MQTSDDVQWLLDTNEPLIPLALKALVPSYALTRQLAITSRMYHLLCLIFPDDKALKTRYASFAAGIGMLDVAIKVGCLYGAVLFILGVCKKKEKKKRSLNFKSLK